MKILDPQYGDNFVGRGEEIREVKEKIENNGIVVVTGDRGIGKTNLIKVVDEDFKRNKNEEHYIGSGLQFSGGMNNIFLPDKIKTGASGLGSAFGFGVGGGETWKPKEPWILEYMEGEKIIFVENAHELKKKELETIFSATQRNKQLRFILEVATPYMPDIRLRPGSYEPFKLKELSDKSIEEIVRIECPNFSDIVVKWIVRRSEGNPYVARSLAYICDNKKTEKEMRDFLDRLRDDDMKSNLDEIHEEVLKTVDNDSREVIKKLAIAPAILTLKLIEAFCGEDMDTPLNDIIERGILVASREKFYQIYHPLFREYLGNTQRIAFGNKKEIYCEAIEKVKSEFDSFFILLEVLNEPDIFKELIKRTENYGVINSIGGQAYTWGELEQALYAWNHLLERTKDNDKEGESIARGNIGNVYRIKGELDTALEYYGKALKLNEELGRKKGELDNALEYYGKALKLDEELGSKGGMAADLGNIGIVYQIKGELDNALEYYGKALKLNEELGSKEGMANQLGNIGNVYGIKGELDNALEYYGKALKKFKDVGNRIETARTLMNIGDIFVLKGEKERALDCYSEAKDLAKGSSVFERVIERLKRLEEE
jgi:tetratricopeptide (TPR) repeat protein